MKTAKRRPGRPPLPLDQVRSVTLRVRLTPPEAEQLGPSPDAAAAAIVLAEIGRRLRKSLPDTT